MQLRWSPAAAEDLFRIIEYLRQENVPAAQRIAKTIYDSAASLKSFPNKGRKGRVPGRVNSLCHRFLSWWSIGSARTFWKSQTSSTAGGTSLNLEGPLGWPTLCGLCKGWAARRRQQVELTGRTVVPSGTNKSDSSESGKTNPANPRSTHAPIAAGSNSASDFPLCRSSAGNSRLPDTTESPGNPAPECTAPAFRAAPDSDCLETDAAPAASQFSFRETP